MKEDRVAGVSAMVRALGFSCTLMTAGAVFAQAEPQKVEKIEVTGSSIKRIEGESALPVTVITRQDIEKTGATSPMELLNLISSNNSLGNVSLGSVIGATTFSAQTASLRGLGGGRTLILINGKRLDGFAGEVNGVQGVDLSVIPFAAIERVEVLKDGASAVYGSDAIGGVINFILRSDYRGAEGTVYYGAPTRNGGGAQERLSVSAGLGDLATRRFNVLLAMSYDHQKPLDQVARNFSNRSYRPEINLNSASSNTFPANITTGGIGVVGSPNCAPSVFEGGRCRYDPSSVSGVEMIPDSKLGNFFGSAKFSIGGDWQAYATALASKSENRYRIQPVPISNLFSYGPNGDIPAAITLMPTSPFYPHALAQAAGVDGQPLDVRWRAVENGPRDTTDTNQNRQLVVGVKGGFMHWDTDGSYFYSEGSTKEVLNGGFPRYSLLLPLLNSGTVNLFGPNTSAISAAIQATNFNGQVVDSKSKNYGFGGKASSEVWNLPNGALAVALGGEVRKETLDQNYNPVLGTGDVSGFGGNFPSISGSRDIRAMFAEANFPVLKNLEVNAAIRNDHYNDFGSTTNPKFSLRWEPGKSVLLRASYGKGFLAPSLYQLFIPRANTVTAPGTTDPVRCPVTQDFGRDCETQFSVITGGNPALKPEKSEQATAGILFEPMAGASMSVDYFKIRLNEVISTGIPYTTVLGDLATYGSLVTRGPSDAAFPNLPGRIIGIDQSYINLGALHIEGMDIEGHLKGPTMTWGRLRFDIAGTYYTHYNAQNADKSYTGGIANTNGAVVTGVIPRWKHYASVTWDTGPWSTTLGNTYQSAYIDTNTDPDGNLREVSSMTLWDLQTSWRGVKNLTLTLGVKNLLDSNPPLTNQPNTFQVGFDPSYYDARARFVYGSARYEFK